MNAAYIPDTLSLEDRRRFWSNYAKWCALFSAAEVDMLIDQLPVRDIVEEHLVPLRDAYGRPRQDCAPYQAHTHLGNRTTYYRFVSEGGWEKSVMVPCSVYMVPNKYQSLRHPAVILPIMHARYPWLAEFKVDAYSLNFYENHVEEFYVRTGADVEGHRSLYVPYAAFKAKDADAIVRRNKEYLAWYNKTKDVWGTMKDLPVVQRFFDRLMAGETP